MSYAATVLADSPIALWEFTETSGNPVSSGGHTAVVSGALLNQTGPKEGKSVYFDGVNDSLTVNPFPDFVGYTFFTYESWVKFGSQASDYPTFIRRDGNGKAFLVRTRGPAASVRVNEMESYHNGQTVMSSPATFSDNQWHHVVMVNNGNYGYLYVDGVLYQSRNGGVSAGGTSHLSDLYIGRGNGSTEFFKGHIAFPAIYDYALTSTQVAAHYNYSPPVGYRGWGIQLP